MTLVAVYGATGFTGKLVCAELARRGVDFVTSGRSPATDRPARVDDPAALRRAFEGAGVVANCAGPFRDTGAPVLEAAIAAGAHYLDTTGELPWMRDAHARFDAAARDAGVAAVPAMGFDFLPGDLAAHVAGSAVEPLEDIVVVYHVDGFGPTRGTLRSSLHVIRTDAGAAARGWFAFPEPIGRKRVAGYPGGEELTVPRHVRTRKVTCRITTDSIAPPAAGPLLPLAVPLLRGVLRSPLAGPLDRAIGRLPEGPSAQQRAEVRWAVAAVARGEDGRSASALVTGPDVYGVTARAIAEGAQRLTQTAARGVVAPAEAFDAQAFLDALAPFGVQSSICEPVVTTRSVGSRK